MISSSVLRSLKCIFLLCCLVREPINAFDANGEPISVYNTTMEPIRASNTAVGPKLTNGTLNLILIENKNNLNTEGEVLSQEIDKSNEQKMLTNSPIIKANIYPTHLMTVSNSATLDQSMNSFSEILLGILQLMSPSCHLVIAYDEAHSTSQEFAILMQLPFPHTVNEHEKMGIGDSKI